MFCQMPFLDTNYLTQIFNEKKSKYMAEECFIPVLAKLSVCDGKNGITMYCVFHKGGV